MVATHGFVLCNDGTKGTIRMVRYVLNRHIVIHKVFDNQSHILVLTDHIYCGLEHSSVLVTAEFQ